MSSRRPIGQNPQPKEAHDSHASVAGRPLTFGGSRCPGAGESLCQLMLVSLGRHEVADRLSGSAPSRVFEDSRTTLATMLGALRGGRSRAFRDIDSSPLPRGTEAADHGLRDVALSSLAFQTPATVGPLAPPAPEAGGHRRRAHPGTDAGRAAQRDFIGSRPRGSCQIAGIGSSLAQNLASLLIPSAIFSGETMNQSSRARS